MAKHPFGVSLYKENNMAERTLAQMIQPQVTEQDAVMVDVYGIKSQAADKVAGVHTALAGAGMIPGVGNVADAVDTMLYLTEGDLGGAAMSALSAIPFLGLFAGGMKTVKSGAKVIKGTKKLEGAAGTMPKMSEKMPRTQTYTFDTPSPHRTKAYVPGRRDKLLEKLESDELDAFEAIDIRRQLDELEPGWEGSSWLQDFYGNLE